MNARLLWAVLLIALLPAGCAKGGAAADAGVPGDGGHEADGGDKPSPVDVATVEARTMPVDLPAIGTVEAIRTAQVSARVTGQIERVWFTEGDEVEADQVLFTLDSKPFDAAYEQALSTAKGSRATAVNARREAKRYAKLVGKGYVTKQDYDTALAQAKTAEATARADEAKLDNAKLDVVYCTIRAPFAGKTGRYLKRVGDTVSANTDALVTVNELQPLRVAFAVPSEWLPRIQAHEEKDGSLQVLASAVGDDAPPHEGKLMFIDNAVDAKTGTILLKAQFENENKRLWPGEFVNLKLVLAIEEEALVVPSAAVQVGQKGNFVFVVKPDRTVVSTPVTVDRAIGDFSVVSEGLSAGDVVVIDGQLGLKSGRHVEIRKPQALDAGQSPDGGTPQ